MNRRSQKTLRRIQLLQYWLTAKLLTVTMRFMRLFPADSVLDFAGWVSSTFGPMTGRHKVALDNLRKAFPELDEEARGAIAVDMWRNMGRLTAEYFYLDRLAESLGTGPESTQFEFSGIDIFMRIRAEDRPHIFFTAHLGNFELLPVAASRFGMQLTALFRPPNNPFIARDVAKIRRMSNYDMVASQAGSAFTLARILGEDGNVGALVDQKFPRGVRTRFFGRKCGTNPLVAKLARQFDCDIYPCRCIRLPNNRFRLEFMERIEPAIGADGEIDVAATMQAINDIVEQWVRETPGQWTWFHRRWDMN